MTRHAVYAISKVPATTLDGRPYDETVAFRVGQPVDSDVAYARWDRLDNRRLNGRRPVVHANRRKYPIAFLEVRAVDQHGRGLGSERHATALLTPYRNVRITR